MRGTTDQSFEYRHALTWAMERGPLESGDREAAEAYARWFEAKCAGPDGKDYFNHQGGHPRLFEIFIDEHVNDKTTLDHIATLMSGNDWDADTCKEIAELVRLTGRTIEDTAGQGADPEGD